MNNTKPRRTIFSTEEKVFLMHCVSKHKKIIECKQTNGSTWNEKNLAWDKIAMEFNANSPSKINRTKESLKKCYENKKAEVRKIAASNRQGLRATGGGVFTPKTDPCLDIIFDVMNRKTVEGLEVEFGGDATEVVYPTAAPRRSEGVDSSENISDVFMASWKSYKGNDLKRAPNEKLRFASDRRRPKVVQPIHTNFLSKQYSEVATLKRDYLKHELQTSINKELREEEEFKLRKRSLELDIQIKELQLKRLKTNSIQFSM
ncbi:hypothetical protein FQR65_LT15062 [Abscondita terminalis]|nr:hypothetical protein FQR65_LT15062 [Abscondita terminalis]